MNTGNIPQSTKRTHTHPPENTNPPGEDTPGVLPGRCGVQGTVVGGRAPHTTWDLLDTELHIPDGDTGLECRVRPSWTPSGHNSRHKCGLGTCGPRISPASWVYVHGPPRPTPRPLPLTWPNSTPACWHLTLGLHLPSPWPVSLGSLLDPSTPGLLPSGSSLGPSCHPSLCLRSGIVSHAPLVPRPRSSRPQSP